MLQNSLGLDCRLRVWALAVPLVSSAVVASTDATNVGGDAYEKTGFSPKAGKILQRSPASRLRRSAVWL